MKRDEVIQQVAAVVGDRHSVDLKHYDLMILVDIYRVAQMTNGMPPSHSNV